MASEAPTRVQALHILVKHKESRNPTSRRDPSTDSELKKRTVADADAQLMEFLKQIEAASDKEKQFRAIAKASSDCGSFAREGDLGMFEFATMQKPFSEASFALAVGEYTKAPVHTASGSHLIMRIA